MSDVYNEGMHYLFDLKYVILKYKISYKWRPVWVSSGKKKTVVIVCWINANGLIPLKGIKTYFYATLAVFFLFTVLWL